MPEEDLRRAPFAVEAAAELLAYRHAVDSAIAALKSEPPGETWVGKDYHASVPCQPSACPIDEVCRSGLRAISGLRDINNILQFDQVVENEAIYPWAAADEMNLSFGAPRKRDTGLTPGSIPSPLRVPYTQSTGDFSAVANRQKGHMPSCLQALDVSNAK